MESSQVPALDAMEQPEDLPAAAEESLTQLQPPGQGRAEGDPVQTAGEGEREGAAPRGGEVFDVEPRPLPSLSDVVYVYVDTETSSLWGHGEIVQLAAKCEKTVGVATFNTYCKPAGDIDAEASVFNNLDVIDGELCLRGNKLECTPRDEMLSKFLYFLQSFGRPVILVAHNASFDLRFMIRSFADYYMLRELANVVVGVVDTRNVFKANQLAGQEKSLEQDKLARKFLPDYNPSMAHEGVRDVCVLEELCSALGVSREHLLAQAVTFSSMVHRQVELQNKSKYSAGLRCLSGIGLSQGMLNKLAEQAFTIDKLAALLRKGKSYFISELREKVTKRVKIIDAIERQLLRVLNGEEQIKEG